jgi:hypothetical protein
MPFPREDAVMIVYDEHPTSGRRCIANLSPETPTRCGWGHEDVKAQVFQYPYIHLYIYTYIYEYVYYSRSKRQKQEKKMTSGIV